MHTLAQLNSGKLTGITRLKIAEGLREFPAEILQLAETLEILDLSGNKLDCLPPEFSQLKNLKILFLSENNFTEFPAVLGSCPTLEMVGFKTNRISNIPTEALPANLRWLILTDNKLEELPTSIGTCKGLQKLMLAGNKLKELPATLANCQNLELLRISANELTGLPSWLFSLPRLAWLAFAGNPGSATVTSGNSLPEIDWQDLEIEQILGEGASGIISRAILKAPQNAAFSSPVAVKVFKGEVTSDGYPKDEMAATIAAGRHPNIIPVSGKIKRHPEQKQGLVFNLIPPVFRNLGNPPSFASCTRDTYPEGTLFSLNNLLTIAGGIASAAGHLHGRGIMHGDLYAHNILTDNNAWPLLSDFGAATIYGTQNPLASQLERLDVRAFGYLLDDLLEHLDAKEKNAVIPKIEALRADCLLEDISARPDFAFICQQLTQMQQDRSRLNPVK